MTAIAALVHNGRVVMGSDSAGVGGWTLTQRRDPKLFMTGSYLIGFTTSYRMGQILRWSFESPAPPSDDLDRFMCTTWINGVREALQDGGWSKKEAEREEGGTFLVGVRGRVDPDFHVGESADNYDAVGSGEALALGAFSATGNMDMEPEKRVLLALAAAERHNIGVRGPFHLLWEAE